MVQSPGVPTLEKQEMQAVRDPLPRGLSSMLFQALETLSVRGRG